jgi:hypothetical protein
VQSKTLQQGLTACCTVCQMAAAYSSRCQCQHHLAFGLAMLGYAMLHVHVCMQTAAGFAQGSAAGGWDDGCEFCQLPRVCDRLARWLLWNKSYLSSTLACVPDSARRCPLAVPQLKRYAHCQQHNTFLLVWHMSSAGSPVIHQQMDYCRFDASCGMGRPM